MSDLVRKPRERFSCDMTHLKPLHHLYPLGKSQDIHHKPAKVKLGFSVVIVPQSLIYMVGKLQILLEDTWAIAAAWHCGGMPSYPSTTTKQSGVGLQMTDALLIPEDQRSCKGTPDIWAKYKHKTYKTWLKMTYSKQ